jgi:hypothetical protein
MYKKVINLYVKYYMLRCLLFTNDLKLKNAAIKKICIIEIFVLIKSELF